MKRFLKRLATMFGSDRSTDDVDLRVTGASKAPAASNEPPAAKPELVDFSSARSGEIEDGGPGKNVLIRNRYLREETGTHETLKIVDDSILETDDEQGFDPYNTGQFDRSKSWNNRTGK